MQDYSQAGGGAGVSLPGLWDGKRGSQSDKGGVKTGTGLRDLWSCGGLVNTAEGFGLSHREPVLVFSASE